MQRIRVPFNRPQWDAFRLVEPGVILAMVFGRGVGKSFAHRRIWYKLISEWDGKTRPGGPSHLRGVRIILLMPTFKQAVDTYAQLLASELETGEWYFLGAKLNRTRWRIEFPGGSWIQFFGAENADSARGMRCDVVSADECDDIDPSVYEQIAIPWLSEPWSLKIQLASGTPRRGRFGLLHKLYQLGHDVAADGSKANPKCFGQHATYLDAPRQVSNDHVESAKLVMSPAAFAREWMASWDSGDGLVYPFDERINVRPFDPKGGWSEILVGVDWGWADPGVFIAVAVRGSGRDAEMHIMGELYEPHQVDSWWVAKAREWRKLYPAARWFADPSQPARIESLRREAGVSIVSGENAIEDGVDCVADRIVERVKPDGTKYARLYVDPRCKQTIREFNTYKRKRDRSDKERVLEAIEDKHNHAMDALRYAIFTRFGKPQATRIEL